MPNADGREARDFMHGLMKTCRKLGISFFTYLGDRIGLNEPAERIPFPQELVVNPPAPHRPEICPATVTQ